jgi:GTP-binding nuclear protein Ran
MKTIILIGDGNVGKTTYMERYISQNFEERYIPTLGVELYNIFLPNNEEAQIRDFAGIEEFRVNRDPFLKNADFAIIMFDLTSKLSWQNIDRYMDKLPSSIPVVLCGNKLDCVRRISPFILNREYNLIKIEYTNIIGLVEISVKKKINLQTPFDKLIAYCNNIRSYSPVLF